MRRSFFAYLGILLCSLLLITSCGGLFRGSVPDIPFIGERVVSLSHYNGNKEIFLRGQMFYALKLLRQQDENITWNDTLYRHASLALYHNNGDSGQQGMIGNLRERAKTDGWQIREDLSVDAPGLSYLLTLEKNGYILALLGLDDAFSLVPDNPGVSRQVAARRWSCEEAEQSRSPMDIGPCPMRGFVPVYVFSNLVDRKRSYQSSSLLDEELIARLLGGREQIKSYPENTVYSAPTWEELAASSTDTKSSSSSD